MDVLIPDLDDSTFRAIRARAALEGRSIGELITEALRAYLARTAALENGAANGTGDSPNLLDEPSTKDEERTGNPVDEIVYLYCI